MAKKPDPAQVYRDAVKEGRKKQESEQAHDRGVAERLRKAIREEAEKELTR